MSAGRATAMIPNVFLSSTIADLHYLRDGLRDAVAELSYNPIMSEYGDVGYINPSTAASSCYRTVRQCQMLVLIIGRRYGDTATDDLSVTQKEFRTARDENIPTITFVESQVLNFKQVFDADPGAAIWDSFPQMDNPRKTFGFIDEVKASESYNGLIPFIDVGDAKKKLKMQIADFVGERLSKTIGPIRDDLRDVMAELKTIRNQLGHQKRQGKKSHDTTSGYLRAMRFLLDDRQSDYRKFLEAVFGDVDNALPAIVQSTDFAKVLKRAGFEYSLVEDRTEFDPIFNEAAQPGGALHIKTAMQSMAGGYIVYNEQKVVLTRSIFDRFSAIQGTLRLQLSY
jgi:Domain of unknown function (DUF4062)